MPTTFDGPDSGGDSPGRVSPARPRFLDARGLTGCRHRVGLDGFAVAGGTEIPEPIGARQRKDAAAAHRARVREELVAAGGWTVVDAGTGAERVAQTLAACAEKAPRIWGALLPNEPDTGRRGGAEILLLDPERGGYLPVIVVNHKVTDPRRPEPSETSVTTSPLTQWNPRRDLHRKVRTQTRDLRRLAHLYRMLQRGGLASPAVAGGVIGAGFDCIVVHDLAPLLADYDEAYADRIAIVRGETPTSPSRVPECRSCPWWNTHCRPQLQAEQDVSLVVSGARAEILRAAGVNTIDELARWRGGPPDDWLSDDFSDVVVAARAWLSGVPLVRRTPLVRVHRADVEVDIDLESFQEHGAYLWGTLLDGVYRPFATWDPLPTVDEARSFAEFWAWLTGVRAAAAASGKTFAAYCYTRTEDKWLLDSARRFAGKPGVPTVAEINALVTSKEWVDIFQAVVDQFICPQGKGLKKIAPITGFGWRDPEAGGEASMEWYRAAVGYDGGAPDLVQRRRVLEYNEDDVRATAALREWMTERAAAETPLAAEL